jgi:hypothetical protein
MLFGAEGIDTLMPMLGKVLPYNAQADSGICGMAGTEKHSAHKKRDKRRMADDDGHFKFKVQHNSPNDQNITDLANAQRDVANAQKVAARADFIVKSLNNSEILGLTEVEIA